MILDHTHSERLYAEACQVIPGGVNSAPRSILPHLMFTSASGATLTDADGHRYIDYHAAFGPALLGHNHPEVNRRVRDLWDAYGAAGVGSTQLEIELARKIQQHVPCAERVLLCTSGSQATFHAVRVSRAVTGRKKIVKFQGCYHGIADSLLLNVASPADKVGHCDPGSAGILPEVLEQTLVCAFNDLDNVEQAFEWHGSEIAAVIVEPIAHNVGCLLPQPGFLEGLRELTRRHGALLIFDEVVTGFRHHLGGYQTLCGITPDLTTLGKAMANGFPIAAVCGRAEIMNHFNTRPGGDTYFAGTYNGNLVGCAAALATIEMLEREPVHARVFALGERMRRGLSEIHQRLGVRAMVAGFGSIFLTYFMEGPAITYTDLLRNDAAQFVECRRRLIDCGVFMLPVNLKRNHISYAHREADIDRTLEAYEHVLKQVAKGHS
jgi:glutamate-1-semialdehyde 2,1-aminomutase